MNVDLPLELRDALTPWTQRLPPGADDPTYTRRYHRLIAQGMHPAVAAIQADTDLHYATTHRREVA